MWSPAHDKNIKNTTLQEIMTRFSVITDERSSITKEYSLPRNIAYIPQLTDETIEEYNTDEYMILYSSVPMNIILYSSVTYNR
jgi:hypothetical protein